MKGLRIRPEQSGLKSSLFDLEAEIMEIVWNLDAEEFSVADVCTILNELREVAYTTVMTTVTRLYEKGLLDRRKEGRKYLYTPKQTRQDFIVALTRKVMGSLPPLGRKTAMSLLVEHVASADDDDLARLEALIRKRREQND